MKDEQAIKNLNFLCKTYDGMNRLLVSTKNRLQAINPEQFKVSTETKGIRPKKSLEPEQNAERVLAMDELQMMTWTKDRITSRIKKELKLWDIWTHWLQDVPGIGPFIAGNLILFYYYKFTPVCQECGAELEKHEKVDPASDKKINVFKCSVCKKKAKGDGVLQHRIDFKDFARVSSWWHYMGMHVVNGVKPKRAKGVVCDWTTKGRTLCYQVGDQFNRQSEDHPYKAFLLKMKKKHERKNADRDKEWSKGHIHNAAKNEAAKLFLSHFWHVARTLEGKDTEAGPYIKQIPGHTIIPPYYWDVEQEKAA